MEPRAGGGEEEGEKPAEGGEDEKKEKVEENMKGGEEEEKEREWREEGVVVLVVAPGTFQPHCCSLAHTLACKLTSAISILLKALAMAASTPTMSNSMSSSLN